MRVRRQATKVAVIRWLGALAGTLAVAGCGSDAYTEGFVELSADTSDGTPYDGNGPDAPILDLPVGGGFGPAPEPTPGLDGPIGGEDRPVHVHVPPGYDPDVPAPLLVLLHGYSVTGWIQEFYLNLTEETDARGYLYAYPDGTQDPLGLHFWNATNACCDVFDAGVDDSTYLRQVVEDISLVYAVDPKRIYFFGHSNGGFMANRVACDHADIVAAFGALAGTTWDEAGRCQPSEPVNALTIHGTLDVTIPYGGGWLPGGFYPGAVETTERWAEYNGCSDTADTSAPKMDIEAILLGKETKIRRYDVTCDPGGIAELWSMGGVGHLPIFKSQFKQELFDFFDAHPKP